MKEKARRGDRAARARRRETDALGLALASDDWERAALLLMLGLTLAARSLPRETIDDVLALLDEGGADGDR